MNPYFILLICLQAFIIIGLAIAYIRSSRTKNLPQKKHRLPANNEAQLYEHILSSTNDFMSFVDSNYIYRAVNQRYLDVFNKTREQVIGQHVEILHGKEQFEKSIKPNMDRCLKGENFHYKHWIEFPKIGRRFIDVYHAPFSEVEGEYSGVVICARDITEQRLAEEKISTAFRSCPDAITITSLDTGLYLEINDAFNTITGYSREEAIGSTLSSLNLWLDTEARARFVSQLKENKKLRDYETDIRIKNGEVHKMQISAEIIDINNEACVLDFSRDVTKQKMADETLRISNERFRRSFQHAPIGMALTDNQGNLIELNQAVCEMTGYSTKDLEGSSFTEITHSEDLEKSILLTQQIVSGKSDHFQLEKRYKHKDGHYIWANTNISAVRDAQQNLLYMIAQVQDITAKKQAEETLHNIAHGVSAATGKEFFHSLAKHLASTLKVDYTVIGEVVNDDVHKLRSVAVCNQGKILDRIEYPLPGTPCETVIGKSAKAYPENVQTIFPDFPLLAELGAESYIGSPLIDSNGEALGLIAVLHSKKIKNVEMAESMLHIFAIRAVAELERMRSESELRRYEQIVSANSDYMAFVDKNYKYRAVNKSYLEAFQGTNTELIGKSIPKVLGDDYFENIAKPRIDQCLTGLAINFQEWVEVPSLGRRYLDIRYNPFYENDDEVSGVVASIRDITESYELSEKLAYQASHDALTNLINRTEFEQRLQRLLDTAKSDKSRHALCYMDLDQFKLINDTCGHLAGDELLRQLSDLLCEQVRSRDSLARLGGDEFALLMEHCDTDQAFTVANKFREMVEKFDFTWEDKRFGVGVSIGLVLIDEMSGSTTDVLKQADAACYSAKEQGRNRIHIYEYDNTDLSLRRGEMNWVIPIQQALESEQFYLYAQPILPTNEKQSGKNIFEILVRMKVDGEMVSPGTFLSAAERYGLSNRLDICVINMTFDLLESHSKKMGDLSFCSINLSGYSLGASDVLTFILNKFNSTSIEPGKICFEITETAAISNLSHAKRFINTLKQKGCLFALDDFGSGFSSFGYLKNLNVDFLKIDGMFIKDIVDDPIDFAMVKSINEIGQVMGMKTIAEFVENEKIMQLLQEIGVDYAQGYHLGMPESFENHLIRIG